MSKFTKEQLDETMHDIECVVGAIKISTRYNLVVEVVMTMIMKAYEEGVKNSIDLDAIINYEKICNTAVGEWIK